MDLMELLYEEVEEAESFLGIKPARELPEAIELVELGPEIHATSSLRGGRLLLSKKLEQILDKVIRKEALSLFIPREADTVPQVYDLPWMYAGVDSSIWRPLREDPPAIFGSYDPRRISSLLDRSSLRAVIREVLPLIRCSASRGQLSFPLYFAILRRVLSRELKLTEAEIKIIRFLSSNPYAKPSEMKEGLGISDATISRSLRRLKEAGFIFGPENVDLWSLGLTVVVADFPNRRKYEEAFWKFPYTYTQMVPVSGYSRIHAYLVVPLGAVPSLGKLSKYGIKVGAAKRTVQRFNYESLRGSLALPSEAYLRAAPSIPPLRVQVTPPPVRLSREDLRVLNLVMRDGRVTEQTLRKAGIRSAKQRLGKLRDAGIVRRYYMVESPFGFDTILVRVRCGIDEVSRLTETLSSLATVVTHYVEGDERYCVSVVLARREAKSDITFSVRAIYGEELELAEEVLDVHTLWLLPEELWDEGRQTFRWEGPLESLVSWLRS